MNTAKQKEKHTKGKAKKEVRRHQNLTEFPDYLWGKKDLIKLDLSDNKVSCFVANPLNRQLYICTDIM